MADSTMDNTYQVMERALHHFLNNSLAFRLFRKIHLNHLQSTIVLSMVGLEVHRFRLEGGFKGCLLLKVMFHWVSKEIATLRPNIAWILQVLNMHFGPRSSMIM